MEKIVDMYVALKRKKDGNESEGCIRLIDYDGNGNITKLMDQIKSKPGTWRLYRSVNQRDMSKAHRELVHYMIDHPDDYRIDSKFKSLLMKKPCRAQKNFLIDIDSSDDGVTYQVVGYLHAKSVKILEGPVETPNGYHIITEPFDVRYINDFTTFISSNPYSIELKHDDLVYLDMFVIEDESNGNS